MIVRNFLFHRVSEETDALWPPMHPRLFERIIRLLRGNFNVVLLEKFLEDPGQFKGKKQVATISFDDGYKDNLEIAAPILLRYDCPASFYVVTDSINRDIPTWTYITDHFFQQEAMPVLELNADFVPANFRSIGWNDRVEGSKWGKQVKPWMKSLPNSKRLWIMQQFSEQGKQLPLPQKMMMNWEEVKQLYNAGFYIGSHSHTHPMLASLELESEIRDELTFSAQQIEQQLGFMPLTISYPIGSWDDRVIKAASIAGYKYGLAVEQRFYDSDKDNVMAIPRTELYNEPWWKTRSRISGLHQKIRGLVK